MKLLLAFVTTLLLSSVSSAGDFTITKETAAAVDAHYTGTVVDGDVERWEEVVEYAGDRVIILLIDTPGGSALEAVDLYFAMEKHPRLATVGGSRFGAWSAGAVMWLAGDYRAVDPGGIVAFHRAYCRWDPTPQPEIGCDPVMFDVLFASIAEQAGYDGLKFSMYLIVTQYEFGTDGWLVLTDKLEYWLVDESTGTRIKIPEKELIS